MIRAISQARAGAFRAAEAVLKPVFESGEEPRVEVAEAIARVYLSTYRLTEADRALDRWIQAAPDDPRPYLWRNEIEERIGSGSAEIIRNYRIALRLDPNLDRARLGLAEVLLKAHLNDESEIVFATHLERNPDSVPGHVGAAQIAVLKGALSTAISEFEEVLRREPHNLIALQELALIELRLNKVAEACARLKGAIEVYPYDVGLHHNYARALSESGDDAGAARETATRERLIQENDQITRLRVDLSAHPNDDEARLKVARWLLDHGHEQEGLQWSDVILRGNPSHAKTCEMLARITPGKGMSDSRTIIAASPRHRAVP